MSKVWVFFYGTFMSAKILKQHGIDCDKTHPAKISGYLLTIRPRVNLSKRPETNTYGGLALVVHDELENLYTTVKEKFGQTYFPYPVLAEMPDGLIRQALCFISEVFDCGTPEPSYIEEMIKCAKEMNAPESYISHIASFLEIK
jgi:hypothetical protein